MRDQLQMGVSWRWGSAGGGVQLEMGSAGGGGSAGDGGSAADGGQLEVGGSSGDEGSAGDGGQLEMGFSWRWGSVENRGWLGLGV